MVSQRCQLCGMLLPPAWSPGSMGCFTQRPSSMQIRDWEPKLSSITDWFGQLQAIDLDSVAPLLRAPSTAENRTRKDAVVRHALSDTFLDTVPDREGDFIKVPKISTGADQ